MALFAVAGQAAMDTAGVALGGGAMKQAQDMFNAQATQNKRDPRRVNTSVLCQVQPYWGELG